MFIKRKFLFFLLLSTLLTSCFFLGYYDITLYEIDKPKDSNERYGDSKIITFAENNKTRYSYEDEIIKITWNILLSTEFAFVLENKSDHSIKIIWDDAVYVDVRGQSGRVMHKGVKYTDKNQVQPASVILKKSTLSDLIVPTDNVYFEGGRYGRGWVSNPLFPNQADSKKKLLTLTQKYIGKTVKILLPLQIQGTINEYIFSFTIDDFTVIKND